MKRLQSIDLKSSSLKGRLSLPGALASGSESESEVARPLPRVTAKPSQAERGTAKVSDEDAILAMGDDKSKLLGYAKACLPIAATICCFTMMQVSSCVIECKYVCAAGHGEPAQQGAVDHAGPPQRLHEEQVHEQGPHG